MKRWPSKLKEQCARAGSACPAVMTLVMGLLVSNHVLAAGPSIGERPAIAEHLDQQAIENGAIQLNELVAAGQRLFDARFNVLDGRGRPGTTGTGAPRGPGQPGFIRTSGPESNSCSGCHAQPYSGGAGDFVANVFVLAQALDPVTDSVDGVFSNERNTPGMFGSGVIEMLAREMSADLVTIRDEARKLAEVKGTAVRKSLETKGVSFGAITVLPDGRVDPTDIEGVDWDLIVKPFHQKGAVVSLREFSNNAMNHHHGMQSVERFGVGNDADGDNVYDELTVGDMTAITVFQAALPAPVPTRTKSRAVSKAIRNGALAFGEIQCDRCHRQELVLKSREFSEPGPFNPAGNLQVQDTINTFVFDLVKSSHSPFVKWDGGEVVVTAFTDLKRHNLNDAELNHFDNEQIPQGLLTGFAHPSKFTLAPKSRPTGDFLTRKLWDAGNSDPYGHRGDLTTLTEAIWFHGGDARVERDAFFALPEARRAELIEFLKSMVVANNQK